MPPTCVGTRGPTYYLRLPTLDFDENGFADDLKLRCSPINI